MTEPSEHIAPGEPIIHAHGITPAESSHAAAESTFTDAQWAFLRGEDYSAGRAVVVLMLGIFSVGVLLYATVAFSVWSRIGFSVFN